MSSLEEKLEPFLWIPINQWNSDNLIGPYLNNSGYCKICDKYIKSELISSHVSKHVREREKVERLKKKNAIERRKESLKRAREMKANRDLDD